VSVLLYAPDPEDSLSIDAWMLSATGVQARADIGGREDIESASAALRDALRIEALLRGYEERAAYRARGAKGEVFPEPPGTAPPALEEAARRLGDVLLPAAFGPSLAETRRLVVVPVHDIGTTPFAMLRVPGSGRLVVEQMSVTIAPSAIDLNAYGSAAWDSRLVRPLVVGNPRPREPDTEWTRFAPLDGAEEEARAVADVFASTALVGEHATLEAVMARMHEADLLYFATHGVATVSDPMGGSFLLLTSADGSVARWTAAEVMNTRPRLGARLAVLSACQTGLGRALAGGVIGLSRAFQLAGVPRVVMSLWRVDDEATRDLMTTFVKRLDEAVPAEALRRAMLEVRGRRPDPVHWASFVVFGTPR
jgi:CHAT domain-containing protein